MVVQAQEISAVVTLLASVGSVGVLANVGLGSETHGHDLLVRLACGSRSRRKVAERLRRVNETWCVCGWVWVGVRVCVLAPVVVVVTVAVVALSDCGIPLRERVTLRTQCVARGFMCYSANVHRAVQLRQPDTNLVAELARTTDGWVL